jgi:diguanylate cyclase
MKDRSPSRRTGVPRRRLGAKSAVTGSGTLAEREAAILAKEKACHRLRKALDLRDVNVDRRELAADRREAANEQRELALLPQEGAVKASARAVVRIRRMNERLVLSTVDAQTRAEAAEQVTALMSQAAQHDCLTGLANRVLLADRLELSIAFARRLGHRVALLFLDLDHFKEVNDTLGHPAGDLLLQSTAKRLQACVRRTDTVCRQGGDEFVILLSKVSKVADAVLTARKVIAAMTRPHLISGHQVSVTVSIGISIFPDDGADAESLGQAADAAMYQAKRNGRNGLQVAAQSLAEPLRKRGRTTKH